MAEIVAGAVVAEQVVTTSIEGSVVAGYALSRPTLPLKVTFTCINVGETEQPDAPNDSLARSYHSLDVIDGDLYVYGGLVSPSTLAGDEMHILKLSNANRSTLGPQYQVLPAIARDGDDVPRARAGHSTCVVGSKIVVYGGYEDVADPKPLEEAGRVWLFDSKTSHWSHLDVANETFPARYLHSAALHGSTMILHGGYSSSQQSAPEKDTWMFDLDSRTWTKLPDLNDDVPDQASMLVTAPPNLAVMNEKLYLITGASDLGSQVHVFDLSKESNNLWTTLHYPTNPMTLSPQPRKGAGLVSITTGMGRSYLAFILGEKEESTATKLVAEEDKAEGAKYWSGVWILQLPSASKTLAQAKDFLRDKTGMDSHVSDWAEAELVVEDKGMAKAGGKSHPGPRAFFASSALAKNQVVMWGGVNPKGEREGDGWVLDFKT